MSENRILEIGYTNWRGKYAVRRIVPCNLWFGATACHPGPQWFLRAVDQDRNAERDFALKDIVFEPADMSEELIERVAEEICHAEQMTIWTGEIAGALSIAGHLSDDLTYDDVISVHRILADEVRRIVPAAIAAWNTRPTDQDEKISLKELGAMFGDSIPIEAMALLYDPGKLSIHEMRAKLIQLRPVPEGDRPTEGVAEAERLTKAKAWRSAAVERRDFSRRAIYLRATEEKDMPSAWWVAQENIIDGMQDRIMVIDELFPEIITDAATPPETRDRGKMVKPKQGAPAGGYPTHSEGRSEHDKAVRAAEAAYDAYCEAGMYAECNPRWEDLSDNGQSQWISAVRAVLDADTLPVTQGDVDAAVRAAVAEYNLTDTLSDQHSRRCAVRGMMVRMGLYEQFNEALSVVDKPSPEQKGIAMTENQIDHMVRRFLQWPLPEDFSPDGGVSFEKLGNAGTAHEYQHQPVGTNVLNYEQARTMVRHMLEGLPDADQPAPVVRDKIARIITLDHLQLLQDFDVDGDLYRLDPECAASAYVTADAILSLAIADTAAAELARIDAMLDADQGDDDGAPILPEFEPGMTTEAKVEDCLHLLERRRDALAGRADADTPTVRQEDVDAAVIEAGRKVAEVLRGTYAGDPKTAERRREALTAYDDAIRARGDAT